MKILLRNSPEAPWQKLEPFEFGGPDGEKKLEILLEKSPDLLTTEGGNPPLLFKRQVAIGNNAVDLLGVDADGKIVMVECKLEANREARRIVVGQILEYAGQLWGKSYEEFDEMLTGNSDLSLVDMVRQQISDVEWSEAEFRAGVENGLKSGAFRLVIAINGMNDELKGIIEYLKQRGGVRLEALELQQFTDEKSGVAVLVPEMYGLIGRTASGEWADLQLTFWKGLLEKSKGKTSLFASISPGRYNWLSTGAGRTGVAFTYSIRTDKAFVELDISHDTAAKNKAIFDALLAQKEPIEREAGGALEWARPDNQKSCQIYRRFTIGGLATREKWPQLQDEMIDAMIKLDKALRGRLAKVNV
jgi:hypothetical protein